MTIQLSDQALLKTQAYINGQWQHADSGETVAVTNPANGEEALYVASHAFRIEGMSEEESEPIIDELASFCTQPHYVYSHKWKSGDVLIWDERATLHRGMPWPYDEPRTLSSICCSVTEADGLETVRGERAA